jgi:hypothetical protein
MEALLHCHGLHHSATGRAVSSQSCDERVSSRRCPDNPPFPNPPECAKDAVGRRQREISRLSLLQIF